MSWFRCSGCGPTQRCDVCGATQCSGLSKDCPGCIKAREVAKGPVPWNMHSPRGVRPTKHNRKWIGRDRRYQAQFSVASVKRCGIKKDRRGQKGRDADLFGSLEF